MQASQKLNSLNPSYRNALWKINRGMMQ